MIFSYLLNMQSHPSWVCGLKPRQSTTDNNQATSHPSWVCGLKRRRTEECDRLFCHTLRGCVD